MANPPPILPKTITGGAQCLQEIDAVLQDAKGDKPHIYNNGLGFASIGIGLNIAAPYTLADAVQEMRFPPLASVHAKLAEGITRIELGKAVSSSR